MNDLKKLIFLVFMLAGGIVYANKTIKISNSNLKVNISTFGAELQSIQDKNGNEYLWQGDSAYWGGRAPNMFPVCVKFKNQKYSYKGRKYYMPDMGLAKISTFKVAEKQKNKVVFELKSNAETLKNYPFNFVFKIVYELQENRLITKFELKNTGDKTMFYAIGGHPGFRFPFASKRENNQLTFSEKFDLDRTEIAGGLVQENQIQWLKNENVLALKDKRIPNAGMFVKEMPSRTIGVGVVGQPAFVELELEDFPNVNIWSPPGMPYACIEPMAGHHDLQNTELDIEKKGYLEKLSAGESKSYQFSIIIKHQTRTSVSSTSELIKAISKAKSGDLILLEEGDYSGQNISLKVKGTKANPIVISAQKSGKVNIKSPLIIKADFITISGLKFIENGMLELSGQGCKVSNCLWEDSKNGKWLRVLPGSSEMEISYNTFQNKNYSNKNLNRDCQLLQIVVRNQNEQHHIHHNLFKDVAKGKTGNGFETLQLITEGNPFDPPPGDCNTLIEDNLFIRCNGESEIISVKSNGNLVRRNTFRACRGGLVLRHGDDNVVTQNYLFGDGEPGSAGVRIQGTGQVVANNYFQDLESYGLGMMDGTPDDLYIRVENAQILFNTFINCSNNFTIGINHSKHPNGTVPKDCKILGNIFYANKGDSNEDFIVFVQNDIPENWTWKDNVGFGEKGLKTDGFIEINPKLVKNEMGIMISTSNTLKTNFTGDVEATLKLDLVGQNWKSNRSIGAIQFPLKPNKNEPLHEFSVGSNF